jgi:hypothetical protein
VLNPVVRMIRVSSRDSVKCRIGISFRSGLKMAIIVLGPYPLLSCDPCGKSYPDDLPFWINLHLLYSPLDPTSNGEGGFIRGKCSLMTPFRPSLTTNPDRPNPYWQVTQRRRKVFRNYNDKQIRLRPGILSSGDNWATRTTFRTTPPSY